MKSIRKKTKYAIYYTNEHDKLHRIDGPAYVYSNGNKVWHINGLWHRIDGPADECSNGTKYWSINGLAHRIDGPATEHWNGGKYFYLFDKYYSKTQYLYTIEHYDSFMDSNEYFGERE